MSSYIRKHKGAIAFSLALHIALVATLAVNIDLPWERRPPPAPVPIQAEIFDAKEYEAGVQRKQDEQRAREAAEAAARQKVIDDQRERELAVQREREREAERIAKVEADLRAKVEADRLAKQRADQLERDRIEAERKRDEERKEQERVAEQRRQQEARERAERERIARENAERQRAAEAEAERARAARASALAQYIRDIAREIERQWVPPFTAPADFACAVNVSQTQTGVIYWFEFGSCGDDAVKKSVEAALERSRLPPPPEPSLFTRDLQLTLRKQPVR